MKNNELKEKIRNNIREEIAISNIRRELDMKKNKNKKIIYTISSMCAVFILGIGVLIGTSNLNNKMLQGESLGRTENDNIKVELNINNIKNMAMAKLDADVKTIEIENLPEKMQFVNKVKISDEYKLTSSYNVYTRDINSDNKDYNILHDYVFNYEKDATNNVKVAVSEIERPLRDYFIGEGEKISKIGDAKLTIYQWKQMYIVSFEYKNMYFDIETTGVTEDELTTLLESIITNVNN